MNKTCINIYIYIYIYIYIKNIPSFFRKKTLRAPTQSEILVKYIKIHQQYINIYKYRHFSENKKKPLRAPARSEILVKYIKIHKYAYIYINTVISRAPARSEILVKYIQIHQKYINMHKYTQIPLFSEKKKSPCGHRPGAKYL